ncbi:MAG: ABC transporter substrate-binding protein [Christensenellales bacterium]|jgi:peptide/nickel transport system substrate-binding protein
MRKLALLTALVMLLACCAIPVQADTAYTQSPMLDEAVASGALAPVEERLPENPASPHDIHPDFLDLEVGNYGGTIRMISTAVNWSDDVFIGMTENLLTAESVNSGVYQPNIVESYEFNEAFTEFTFKLRKGLKWSDGVEVTMDDVEFCVNAFIKNEEINPVIAGYMRDAGSATGEPFTFTRIDDETFMISFNQTYGGFLAHISISGWKGYTDWIKPAHYLKPFHKDYAEEVHGSLDAYYEFLKPFAEAIGYDDPTAETVWVTVINQVDVTNWECSDATDMLTTVTFAGTSLESDFPHLYPWVMTRYADNYYYYERNPYYFKVDADGQQLPYADEMLYYTVESNELAQLEIIAGNVDFVRAIATVDNLTLYRENGEKAGIEVYVGLQHNHPTDLSVNMNYGLNIDGTVKDDDASRAWQEVVNLIEFRQAITIALDAQEIIDSVYLGLAEPQVEFGCVYDIEGAMELLDSVGIVDQDGDGFRETPSGLPLQWQIWTQSSGSSDYIQVCELAVEYWREIGLNASAYATDSSLLATSNSANEIPMRTINAHAAKLFFYQDWATSCWGPLWQQWLANGGLAGKIPADTTDYLVPPQNVQDFYLMDASVNAVTPEVAINEIVPQMIDYMAENLFLIMHSDNIQKCVVADANIGNMPTGGLCISFGFALETLYHK